MEQKKIEHSGNNYLTINGSALLDRSLDYRRYYVACEIEVNSIGSRDNKDGTKDGVIKSAMTGPVVVKNDLGGKIYSKDKRSQSKQTRNCIWIQHSKGNTDIKDEELYYEFIQKGIRANIEDIERLILRGMK